jgi:hypothetical protein
VVSVKTAYFLGCDIVWGSRRSLTFQRNIDQLTGSPVVPPEDSASHLTPYTHSYNLETKQERGCKDKRLKSVWKSI